jgi:3-methyladenine DNA glycosylase AlkC
MQKRRGARHPSLVPTDIRTELERGVESANHMEQIAMDMGNLLAFQFPEMAVRADEVRNVGLVTRMRAGGRVLYEELGVDGALKGTSWSSDTARGWAAMVIGHAPNLPLRRRLQLIRPFADDPHFAVREWAWLSLRPHIAQGVASAVEALREWTEAQSDRLRRFAIEVTRPRGVWCEHLPALKQAPDLGVPLLEPLRADPSRYVQDSVSNWLNDASKSSPEWVRLVCESWLSENGEASTERICRRACRTLKLPLETESLDL